MFSPSEREGKGEEEEKRYKETRAKEEKEKRRKTIFPFHISSFIIVTKSRSIFSAWENAEIEREREREIKNLTLSFG